MVSGVSYSRLGLRKSFVLSFSISVCGSFAILCLTDVPDLMPIFVMCAKFGIASAFNLVYVSNADVFPTLFSVTAMGICNFGARIATIMAPEIAEAEAPLPMMVFCALSATAIVVTTFVRPLKEQ